VIFESAIAALFAILRVAGFASPSLARCSGVVALATHSTSSRRALRTWS
jgi:hypothetical protein